MEELVIVCLCGSTRFAEAFERANVEETLQGKIVLTIGCDFRSPEARARGLTQADKERLDELHLRKIDLADEILVLNVGGYIGDSTRREIEYARLQRKRIRFLELCEEATWEEENDEEADDDSDDGMASGMICGSSTICVCPSCALLLCSWCEERYGTCGCEERMM